MNFNLCFCADGILRASFSEDKPMIPVKFLQEQSSFKDNDFRFWTKWWESKTFFEDGLTVSSFLKCLEPWGVFWSDLTGKDVVAYIKEVRKPVIVSDDPSEVFDWIQLSHCIEADMESEFFESDEDKELFSEDLNAWFNSAKKMRLTGEWSIYNTFSLHGFKNGEDINYGVEYTSINKLANVPLILNPKIVFSLNEHQLRRYNNKENATIIKKGAFGVVKLDTYFHLMGKKEFNIREIVEGFFWWMFSNPQKAETFLQSLKDDVDEIMEQDIPETIKNESNVVSIFSKSGDLTEEDVKEAEEELKREVRIAPGAFDSIINRLNDDEEYWNDMLEKAKSDKVIVKIGKTIHQTPPENRFFYKIVTDESISMPKPNDYKDI